MPVLDVPGHAITLAFIAFARTTPRRAGSAAGASSRRRRARRDLAPLASGYQTGTLTA